MTAVGVRLRTDVVVIGAGQAGLSAAYHLKRRGLAPVRGFVVLDQSPSPGGAWQFRWPSLTLSTVNRIHDLPGLPFADVVGEGTAEVPAAVAVPRYYAEYERRFELPIYRPVHVSVVENLGADGYVYGTSEAEGAPADIIIRVPARENVHRGDTLYVTTDPHHVGASR